MKTATNSKYCTDCKGVSSEMVIRQRDARRDYNVSLSLSAHRSPLVFQCGHTYNVLIVHAHYNTDVTHDTAYCMYLQAVSTGEIRWARSTYGGYYEPTHGAYTWHSLARQDRPRQGGANEGSRTEAVHIAVCCGRRPFLPFPLFHCCCFHSLITASTAS
jgi:hypothetical protein